MFGFELIAAIMLLMTAAGIGLTALRVPLSLAPHFWAGAGAFPFILGAVIFILSAFWIADMLGKRRAVRDVAHPPVENPPSAVEQIIGPRDRRIRLYFIALLTIAFVFVLIPVFGTISNDFGFIGATFVFTLASLKLFSRLAAQYVVIVSVLTATCVYFIFTYGLSLPMPR